MFLTYISKFLMETLQEILGYDTKFMYNIELLENFTTFVVS